MPTCPTGPGFGTRSPIVGVMLSMFLLAFAGIPLTSGFVSKFAVFRACFRQRGAAGNRRRLSGVAAYFYVRVIVSMFFTEIR